VAGAGYGEKDPARRDQRNGHRERDWETRAGTVELRIPKLSKGSYFPKLPRAPTHGREGADRSDSGGLHPGHLYPVGQIGWITPSIRIMLLASDISPGHPILHLLDKDG